MFNLFKNKVRKTKKGIIVNRRSSGTIKAMYYKDGNYPDVPENPQNTINEYNTTNEEVWFHELGNHIPDRIYNFID